MSNKEMKDELQEDTSGVSDENTGIEEEINATMDKIIAPPETDEDEMDDLGDYDDSAEEEPDPQPVRHHRKSARPGPVVYWFRLPEEKLPHFSVFSQGTVCFFQ